MNILLCGASMGIGGAETHVLTLAKGLISRGHRVTVAAERGALCRELAECGARFVRLPLSGKRTVDAPWAYLGLRELIIKGKFDVVHAHSRLSAFLVSRVRRREGLRFRFIVTAHAKYRTSRATELMSVWGDSCIAVSEDIKRHLVKGYGVSEGRITVIPNGIDTDLFRSIGQRQDSSVLFVSRLDRDCSEGARALCRIAPRLCAELPDTCITIAGGGDDLPLVSRLAKRANAAVGRECVTLVGDCRDVPSLIARHRCVVGVSRVALEAMSMGRTVVLFGNEGALGLLDEGNLRAAERTNFTCRGHTGSVNDEFLRSSLVRALSLDEPTGVRLGNVFAATVREKYSSDRMTDSILKVYESEGLRITLGGYYGYGNLGDDSMLLAMTEELKARLPNCRIAALTGKGRSVAGLCGVETVDRGSLRAVVRLLREGDVYISGGGSLFQNSSSLRSLLYYCGVLRLAARFGNVTVVLANGLGPLRGCLAKRLAACALLAADRVSVRDGAALGCAAHITKGRARVRLSADPVFADPERFTEGEMTGRGLLSSGVRYLAVGLNGVDSVPKKALARAIGKYCKRERLLPVFVSMDSKFDKSTAKSLALEARGVAVADADAAEVCEILRHARLAIGSRLHFLIFALCVGTPFVPVTADPKVEALSLEVLGAHALRINRRESADVILEELDGFIGKRLVGYGERATAALERLKKRSRDDFSCLSRFLRSKHGDYRIKMR